MTDTDDTIPQPQLTTYRRSSILFGLTGGLIFCAALAVFLSQQVWFQRQLTIHVITPSSLGLVTGTPVRMSGLRIGVLDSMKLLPNGHVNLILKVPLRYRAWLSPRSIAKISADSLFSQSYVELSPAPAVPSSVPLSFKVAYLKTTSLEDLLLGAQRTQIQLSSLLASTRRVTDKSLPSTLKGVNNLMQSSSDLSNMVSKELPSVINSSSSLAKTIQKEVPPTTMQLRSALRSVEQTAESAKITSLESQRLITEIRPEIKASMLELRKTLSQSNKLLQDLQFFISPSSTSQDKIMK